MTQTVFMIFSYRTDTSKPGTEMPLASNEVYHLGDPINYAPGYSDREEAQKMVDELNREESKDEYSTVRFRVQPIEVKVKETKMTCNEAAAIFRHNVEYHRKQPKADGLIFYGETKIEILEAFGDIPLPKKLEKLWSNWLTKR